MATAVSAGFQNNAQPQSIQAFDSVANLSIPFRNPPPSASALLSFPTGVSPSPLPTIENQQRYTNRLDLEPNIFEQSFKNPAISSNSAQESLLDLSSPKVLLPIPTPNFNVSSVIPTTLQFPSIVQSNLEASVSVRVPNDIQNTMHLNMQNQSQNASKTGLQLQNRPNSQVVGIDQRQIHHEQFVLQDRSEHLHYQSSDRRYNFQNRQNQIAPLQPALNQGFNIQPQSYISNQLQREQQMSVQNQVNLTAPQQQYFDPQFLSSTSTPITSSFTFPTLFDQAYTATTNKFDTLVAASAMADIIPFQSTYSYQQHPDSIISHSIYSQEPQLSVNISGTQGVLPVAVAVSGYSPIQSSSTSGMSLLNEAVIAISENAEKRVRRGSSEFEVAEKGGWPVVGKDKRRKVSVSEEEKRETFLERNRLAALKCRQKKKQWVAEVQEKVEKLGRENEGLKRECDEMIARIEQLRESLRLSKQCPVANSNGLDMTRVESFVCPHIPVVSALITSPSTRRGSKA